MGKAQPTHSLTTKAKTGWVVIHVTQSQR